MAPAVSCGWHRQELPEGVAPGRYFLWRKTP
jgi:hypothetical protein